MARLRKTFSFLIIALLTAALPVHAEAGHEDTFYVAGTGLVGLSCDADKHRIIPRSPTDPSLLDPFGWALSGEPECAYSDALNEAGTAAGGDRQAWGLGAARLRDVGPFPKGTLFMAETDDGVFGADASYIFLDLSAGHSAEGCGPQSFVLQLHVGGDVVPLWAFVNTVGIDDDTTVCFASSGNVRILWLSP